MKKVLANSRLARRLFERGIRTELGIAKRGNKDAAWQDYRRAAILGDHQAQYHLALHYAAGWDGHKNHRLAMAWFKRAAEAGEELCFFVVPQPNSTAEEQIRSFGELLRFWYS